MKFDQLKMKSVFEELLLEKGFSGQRVHRRIDQSAPIKIHAACVFPHKSLVLEIGPIKKAWLPQDFKKPKIKGIGITINPEVMLPESDVTLFMELMQNDSLDVFVLFCTRVCEELDMITKPELAVKVVLSLIEKWKNFFAGGFNILSENRQTGLYGELYALCYFLNFSIDLGSLINAWTGSGKTNQDFEFGPIALEVKASTAVDTDRVSITNSKQLDDSGLDKLFLFRVLFDARRGVKNTLPDLINFLRNKIKERAYMYINIFEEKLLAAGYQKKHIEHYNQRSYSEKDLIFYSVRDGFPRLLKENLPIGVVNIKYELSLDSCNDFIIEADTVINDVRDICD